MSEIDGLKRIYSYEVEKLKEDYDNQILQKKNSIYDLKSENERLKEEIKLYIEKERKHDRLLEESIQIARKYHK